MRYRTGSVMFSYTGTFIRIEVARMFTAKVTADYSLTPIRLARSMNRGSSWSAVNLYSTIRRVIYQCLLWKSSSRSSNALS